MKFEEREGLRIIKPFELVDGKLNISGSRTLDRETLETGSMDMDKVVEMVHSLQETGTLMGVGNKSDYYADKELGLGVKRLSRPQNLQYYEAKDLREEATLQVRAYLLRQKIAREFQEKIEKNPERREFMEARMTAKVPEIIAHVQDLENMDTKGNPTQYLIMETVRGRTLSHMMYQKIADIVSQRNPGEFPDLKDSHEWREDVLREYLFTRVNDLIGKPPGKRASLIHDTLYGSGVISQAIAGQIANLQRGWNSNGFFHRDLHEKNIIISEDGSQASVIDFGSSVESKGGGSSLSREAVYDVGGDVSLWRDESTPAALMKLSDNAPQLTAKQLGAPTIKR